MRVLTPLIGAIKPYYTHPVGIGLSFHNLLGNLIVGISNPTRLLMIWVPEHLNTGRHYNEFPLIQREEEEKVNEKE